MTYDRMELNIAAWVARHDLEVERARERLDARLGPVARAVLDLHAAVPGAVGGEECAGCHPTGPFGDDSEPWPCDTTRAVAKAMGITFPEHDGWADDPDFDPHAPVPGYPTDIEATT